MSEEPVPEPVPEPVNADVEPVNVDAGPASASANASAGSPFSVLQVLTTALRVIKRNLIPFLVIACVLEAPVLLFQLGLGEVEAFLAFALQMVSHSLTSAVVTYGVIMELQGSRPSTRACIVTGFAQLGRVLGVTLISTIAVIGAMLLLIIPGVIVALMFFVIVPVTVVEKVGIDAAMKRSRELTQGRKGDLFLIMMLGGAVSIAIELVAHYELGPQAAFVWRAAGSAFTTMYFSVTAAVVYVVLRQIREGTQVPELARAFARVRK